MNLDLYQNNYQGGVIEYPEHRLPQGIKSVYGTYFSEASQAELFWILTQTPQTVNDILSRQAAVKDMIQCGNAFMGYGAKIKDLERKLRDREIVKIWKEDRSGYETPLVYDHKKLEARVQEFQNLCAGILSSLEGARGEVFARLRTYFSGFTDSHSETVKQWELERDIMDKAGLPLLGIIDREPWTRSIEGIQPIGFVSRKDLDAILEMIREGIRKGVKEITFTVDGVSIMCELIDMPKELDVRHEKERQVKRYIDFDLFLDIREKVENVLNVFKRLRLYKHAADMHIGLKKQGLPVCFPEIKDEELLLDVQDFYPLHSGLKPRQYIFNSLRLDSENPIALVTGLNSGGKSSLLHTIDVISSLSRAGFPIPASKASIGNFLSTVHHEIVGGDIRGTSTFRGQTKDAMKFLDELDESGGRLGLLDEAVSGTDAVTGKRAIGEILKIISHEIKKPTIIVTHFTEAAEEVRDTASEYPGIKLYCFRRNAENKPTFKLDEGIGLSEGSYILVQEGLTLDDFRKRRKKK